MKLQYLFLNFMMILLCLACSTEKASFETDTGTGGSMAKFTAYGDYLYTIDNQIMKVFDVHQPDNPQLVNTIEVGFGIETIYPYRDKLFVGASTGMYIFDLTDPSRPARVTSNSQEYWHVTSCDPVVVQNNYAFITLRLDRDLCNGGWVQRSRLEVLDISDMNNIQLVKEYPMDSPYGLGVDNNLLFVCDGQSGLKIFDCTDPANLVPLQTFTGIETYDVIPMDGILMVVGPHNLYQFDYSNPTNIKQLSTIKIAS